VVCPESDGFDNGWRDLGEDNVKWFLDRKLGVKQLLSFVSVLTLTVLLAVFSLVKLAAVRAATVEITDHRIPAMRSLSDLKAGLFQYRISEMSYVFTEDPDERNLRTSNMETGMKAVQKAIGELEPLVTSPEERKLLGTIQQDVEQCKSETQTILNMIRDKKTPDAISEVLGSAQGNFTQAMDDIQADLDLKVKGATDASQDSARTYQSSQWGVVAMSLVAVGLGLFLAVFTSRLIAGPVQQVALVARQVAGGDLTHEDLKVYAEDEIGELARSVNEMQANLREMIGSVSASIERIATASEELSANAASQAQGADTQKQRTDQVAEAMQGMSSTVAEVAENSSHASEASRKAADTARQGGVIVEDMLVKMRGIADSVAQTAKKVEGLGQRSNQIGEIIGTIDDIADQTNLLALNAAIEAARAGEQGRGFAVVADEVRKLAERTRRATKEITEMIQSIQTETQGAVEVMQAGTQQVKLGVESTTRAGASLREIIQTSEAAGALVTAIASAAAAQRGATQEISANIEQIADITQGTAAGAKESAKAINELSTLAMDLQAMVGKFKVSWASDGSQYNNQSQYDELQYDQFRQEPWHGRDGPLLPGKTEGQLVDASQPQGKDAFSATVR